MSRMTPENVPQPNSEVLNRLGQIYYDGTAPITASNDELILPDGMTLAIVDRVGRVMMHGSSVEAEVFRAVSTAVVDSFCRRFKGFSDADFKRQA